MPKLTAGSNGDQEGKRAPAQRSEANSMSAAALPGGRSARGQFLPGPRERPREEQAKAAVLANPDLSVYAIAKHERMVC